MWMHVVLIITIYDFFSWLVFLFLPRLRYSFFIERTQLQEHMSRIRIGMEVFVYEYLQHDGFFILRLIHSNIDDDITSNILTNLWKHFQRTKKSSIAENVTTNLGATVSLTATGNRGIYDKHNENRVSTFEYSNTEINL